MTPVFCCGYECGLIGAIDASPHINTGTNTSISTSTVRSGARSLRVNPTAGNGRADFDCRGFLPGTSITTAVWRYAINVASNPLANIVVGVPIVTSTSVMLGLAFKSSDSKWYCGSQPTTGGAVTFGATGVTMSAGWHYIDCKVTVGANPWTVDVAVDGVALTQLTIGVAAQAVTILSSGSVATSATYDLYLDDVVLSTTAGDYPIGDGYVNHFVPTADGTHNVAGANDFERSATGTDITNATTTAFQLIDDVPVKSGVVAEYINLIAPPNATDYVEVVYGPASGISTPTVAPRAVEVVCVYASASVGTNNLRLAVNDNGTTNDVFNANGAIGTTAAYVRKHYATPPAASSTIDSYVEANKDSSHDLGAFVPILVAAGQSFTATASVLGSAVFYLAKVGTPTGDMVAKLYASTGTHGTSAVPDGSALASSDVIDASTLTGSFVLTTFTFSGSNRVTLTNGVVYIIVIECLTVDASNKVSVGCDGSTSAHGGNRCLYQTSWTASGATDLIFYVKTSPVWTLVGAGNFNNLRMRCLTNDPAPDPWFASTMVEAEFAAAVVGGRTTKNTRAWPLGTEIGMNWVNSADV